jgi:hypothetical protein
VNTIENSQPHPVLMESDVDAVSDHEDDEDKNMRENDDEDLDDEFEEPKKKTRKKKSKRVKDYSVTNFLNYTFEDIQQHFDHPISRAAKNLAVSETYLKKLCRHFNIYRWPYRKLTSLQKRIDHLVGGVREDLLSEEILLQVAEIREEMHAIKINPSLVLKSSTKGQDKEVRASKETRTPSPEPKHQSTPPTPTQQVQTLSPPRQPKKSLNERLGNTRYAPYPQLELNKNEEQKVQTLLRNSQQYSNTPALNSSIIQSQQQVQIQHLPQQQIIISPYTNTETNMQRKSIDNTSILQLRRTSFSDQTPLQYSPLGLRLDTEEVASILQEVQHSRLVRPM